MGRLILILAATAAAQNKDLCRNRESHFTYGGHNYIYSGQSKHLDHSQAKAVLTGAKGAEVTAVVKDFAGASAWCEERCMALVSLETEGEWREVRSRMEAAKAPFVWTSGHICDRSVGEQCYTEASLQPRLTRAWFWSGSGARIGRTDKRQPGWRTNPWGTSGLCSRAGEQCLAHPAEGHQGVRQPDNAEQRLAELIKSESVRGEEESCLALATGLWQEETVWNDISCYHEKEWICEDNEKLLAKVGLV